jgi:microcystin-dependent protein
MTSLASSFTYNGFFIGAPVGTIVSYMGITDPDGWIICDGVTRTGGAGRYAALKDILNGSIGGSNTQDSVTPPDLRSRFLYGKPDKNTVASALVGSSTVTLSLENMPSHTHDVTANQGSHTHTITQPTHNHTATQAKHSHTNTITQNEGGTAVSGCGFNDIGNSWNDKGSAAGNYMGYGAELTFAVNEVATAPTISVIAANANISLDTADPPITVSETLKGSGAAFSLPVPTHFTVNYIIKY